MLSRVANSIYWMSRYLERADNVARFAEVNGHLMLDLGLERKHSHWQPLVFASGDHVDFSERYSNASEKEVLRFLTFDDKNPNSILSCIASARENARTIRENIPAEMWESINELFHLTQKHSRKRSIDDLQTFYERVHNISHLITGFGENIMNHGEGWHFARIGTMLERSDKTARLIDIKYFFLESHAKQSHLPYDALEWSAVLKSVNATDMYRKKHHSFSHRDVAHFLIFNPTVPRSIAFCVNAAATSLHSVIDMEQGGHTPATQEMQTLLSSLQMTDIDQILDSGLHEFIDKFQYNLNLVDESISQSFFC